MTVILWLVGLVVGGFIVLVIIGAIIELANGDDADEAALVYQNVKSLDDVVVVPFSIDNCLGTAIVSKSVAYQYEFSFSRGVGVQFDQGLAEESVFSEYEIDASQTFSIEVQAPPHTYANYELHWKVKAISGSLFKGASYLGRFLTSKPLDGDPVPLKPIECK